MALTKTMTRPGSCERMWYKSASRSSCVGEGNERVSGERFGITVPSAVVERKKKIVFSVTGAAPEAAHMRLVAFE
jgi:hypothetical protein